MSRTKLTVQTLFQHFPITVVHSPDMPAATKVSERPFSWSEVHEIVAANELEVFARSRPQMEKYLEFKRQLRLQHTTVYKHLLTETLKWASESDVEGLADQDIKIASSGLPIFSNAADLKIINNDFPYYFEANVSHLCVWTKQPIEADPNSSRGDISDQTRRRIEAYVHKTFVEHTGIPRENILWFRNWDALQSVREISHVHVLVKDATSSQLESLIDTPGYPLDE